MRRRTTNLNDVQSTTTEPTRIEYCINRGPRRRSRLVVTPDGSVEARVPQNATDEWVESFVRRQRHWIVRQQAYFEQFRPREPERRYVAGETLRYLGRQYSLSVVVTDAERVRLRGRELVVETTSSQTDAVRAAVQDWYRRCAREVFERRAERCVELTRPHGIGVAPIVVRSMVRRWGSCTPTRRILLNPHLVVAPTDCIDYVLVHELCHVRHRRHDPAFYRLLSTVMPDWSRRRARLEKFGPYLTL